MAKKLTLIALLFLFLGSTAYGMLREVSLNQRIDDAVVVVEGMVVRSTPFFNEEKTKIFTAHEISVSRVFKSEAGNAADIRTVKIITPGGRIDGEWHDVRPALKLTPGDAGVFFLEAGSSKEGASPSYRPYAGPQGLVRYGLDRSQGRDPFRHYTDVLAELHDPIQHRVNREATVVRRDAPWQAREPRAPGPEAQDAAGGGPLISTLDPLVVAAGVQETLTITGSGFGTLTGVATVLFDSADDGPGGAQGSVDPEHIVSWSDTVIEVLVPSRLSAFSAGSGNVWVQDSAGTLAISPQTITVKYALTEALTSVPGIGRISLENENVLGGYTYRYSTSTANSGVDITSIPDATARFGEALELWNCQVGWNVEISGTTAVQATGNDGVNMVSFDWATDPLPGGVLGRASNFYTNCGGDTWWLNGIDIRFKRDGTGANWYYGAFPIGQGAGEDDFMTVALHETGHSVQHGHINNASDVMHYALTQGTSIRTLSADDIEGGMDIVDFSAAYNSCGNIGMTALDCTAPPSADFSGTPRGACGSQVSVQFEDLSLNRPTSWAWTFGDGGMSTEQDPSHDYNSQGFYSVSLTATNANGGDPLSRNGYIVLTDAPASASCDPTTNGHDNGFGIGVYNVSLNDLDHSTDSPTEGDPIVEDFSCSQFTALEPGANYDISVTTGAFNNEHARVYIDWDADGTLEAGELVLDSVNMLENHMGNFSVPGNAVEDTALRMRVISDFGNPLTGPCDNLDFGQSEDYSVVVHEPVPDAPVIDPEVAVAICGTTAHYAWVRFENGGTNPNIIYRNCTVGGACNGVIKLVGAATAEGSPAVACEDSTVLVMWEDYRDGNADLAYRRSTDTGATFGGLEFLVKGIADETAPVLAMSGGVTLAVWEDARNGNKDLASRRSTDGGATWGTFGFLVKSPFDDSDPILGLDGNAGLLGWVDRRFGNQDVAYRRTTDAGVSWQNLTFLVKAATVERDPTLAVDGTNMMIAWSDSRSGNQDLAFRRSVDSGATFAGLTFLVKAPSDDSEPTIRLSGSNGLISWVDERNVNQNISFRRSGDSGASWGATARLVAAATDEFGPACDLLSNLGACVWVDTRTGDPKPHARQSVDGGLT